MSRIIPAARALSVLALLTLCVLFIVAISWLGSIPTRAAQFSIFAEDNAYHLYQRPRWQSRNLCHGCQWRQSNETNQYANG